MSKVTRNLMKKSSALDAELGVQVLVDIWRSGSTAVDIATYEIEHFTGDAYHEGIAADEGKFTPIY